MRLHDALDSLDYREPAASRAVTLFCWARFRWSGNWETTVEHVIAPNPRPSVSFSLTLDRRLILLADRSSC